MVLAACGATPQPTVLLDTNMFKSDTKKVGIVYIAPSDKATTHIFGASCLLCYGVASALTAKLDKHLESTISSAELNKLRDLVFDEYSQVAPNVEFVKLPVPVEKMKKFKGGLGFSERDFRSLKESTGVDLLVVFDVTRHGAYRSFTSYSPNGDPQGNVSAKLYTVDLDTNAYIQYLEIDEKVQPLGEWDEPPVFPSVTTSYYQAIENASQKIKDAI